MQPSSRPLKTAIIGPIIGLMWSIPIGALVTFMGFSLSRSTFVQLIALGIWAIAVLSLITLIGRLSNRSRLRALRQQIITARAQAVLERTQQVWARVRTSVGGLAEAPFVEARATLAVRLEYLPDAEALPLVLRHELEHLRIEEPLWRRALEPRSEAWREPSVRSALLAARGRLDTIDFLLQALVDDGGWNAVRSGAPTPRLRQALLSWWGTYKPEDMRAFPANRRVRGDDSGPAVSSVSWFDSGVPTDPSCGPAGLPGGGHPEVWCDAGSWGGIEGSPAGAGDAGSFGGSGGDSGGWGGGGDSGGWGGGDGGGGGGDGGGGGGGD